MKAFIWSFVTSSGLLSEVRKLLFTDQIIKNSWGVHWSKDSVEHLFQNMRPSLWNAQPSFWNTRPSFWGFRRKLKAQLRVCVITRPMLSQSAMVRLGPKHVLICTNIYSLNLIRNFSCKYKHLQWFLQNQKNKCKNTNTENVTIKR